MQIMRPKNSRFVKIFGEDGNEVVTIDVAVALSTVYPEGSLGREVQFTTSFLFTEGMQYYVQMDPGVFHLAFNCMDYYFRLLVV